MHRRRSIDNLLYGTYVSHPVSFGHRLQRELRWLALRDKLACGILYYFMMIQKHRRHQVLQQCLLVEPVDRCFHRRHDLLFVLKAFGRAMQLQRSNSEYAVQDGVGRIE